MKTTIAALALTGVLWGCGGGGEADPPPDGGGSGGTAATTGGTGGASGRGGTAGEAQTGGSGGSATGGTLGSGGATGTGGTTASGGMSGAAGASATATCLTYAWTPYQAQQCDNPDHAPKKNGYSCWMCSPGFAGSGRQPDCLSDTAVQNITVLCVLDCSECS